MSKANNETVWISCMINSSLFAKFIVFLNGKGFDPDEMPLDEMRPMDYIMHRRYNAGFHLSEDEKPREFVPWPSFSPIARPQLADFFGGTAEADGSQWRIEQMISPGDRHAALTIRIESPYLVSIVDGRALIADFAISVTDAQGIYWRLASGTFARLSPANDNRDARMAVAL